MEQRSVDLNGCLNDGLAQYYLLGSGHASSDPTTWRQLFEGHSVASADNRVELIQWSTGRVCNVVSIGACSVLSGCGCYGNGDQYGFFVEFVEWCLHVQRHIDL